VQLLVSVLRDPKICLMLRHQNALKTQALCGERGASSSQANLQLEMLTEKVQLLTAELNQQEQDANELVRELQQQLAAVQGKLREYQAAEGVLDQAVLGAAAAGE
jgi:ABC-type transporter Mla subunit MlaD